MTQCQSVVTCSAVLLGLISQTISKNVPSRSLEFLFLMFEFVLSLSSPSCFSVYSRETERKITASCVVFHVKGPVETHYFSMNLNMLQRTLIKSMYS